MAEFKLVLSGDASGLQLATGKATVSVVELGASSQKAGESINSAMGRAEAGVDAASKSFERLGKVGTDAAGDLDRELGKAGASTNALGASIGKLDAATQAGLSKLNKELDTNQAVLGRVSTQAANVANGYRTADAATEKYVMSAKAQAAAMRGIPAQFTDIVTSIQAGQNPMTVLLQQGGQLKDMFGGIGPAARALGGYVLGLVNPLTLAAAAAGVLGFAYNKGGQEATEYSKSIILSGNAAGTTVGQLQAMAGAVASSANVTKGLAAEALAIMAGQAKVAGTDLASFTSVAVRMEREVGTSVEETAKQFAALAKDPLTASLKLNEATNYLTLSTYQQIKALTEQGRASDAAALAQSTYADAMRTRLPQLEASLGGLERAWRATTGAAKSAWDAMLNIGREEGPQAKIAAAEADVAALQRRLSQPSSQGVNTQINLNAELTGLQAKLALMKGVQVAVAMGATAEADRGKALAANVVYDKLVGDAADKKVKMQRELDAARQAGLAAGKTELEIEKELLVNIRAKYAEKGKARTAADPFAADRAAANEWAKFYTDFAGLTAQAEAETLGLSKAQAKLLEYLKSTGYANASDGMRQLNLNVAYGAIATEQLAAATKEDAKQQALDRAERVKNFEALETETDKLQEAIKKQTEHNEAIGSTKESVAELTAVRLDDQAASKEALALVADEIDWSKQLGDQYRAQAAGLRDLAALKRAGGARETGLANAKAEAQEAKKVIEGIDKTAQDVWRSVFEGGSNAFEQIGKAIKREVIDVLYQMVSKKWVINMGTSVAGSLGFSQAAQAGSSLLGSAGDATGGLGSLASIGSTLGSVGTALGTFGTAALASTQGLIGLTGTAAQASVAVTQGLAAATGASTLLTTLGAAVPYVAAALIVAKLLAGPGWKSSASTGDANASFDAMGNATGRNQFSGIDYQPKTSSDSDSIVNTLQGGYAKTAQSLGIKTVASNFSYYGNTGAQGENPNFGVRGSAGGRAFDSGETRVSKEALELASTRAIFAALQGSDLPKYLSSVFDSIDPGASTQEQIAGTLAYAQSLKQVREALLETRAPLQILKDSLADGNRALNTTADTFKTDFVAAIDAGITAEGLAQWKGLQNVMLQLEQASGEASSAVGTLVRSIADIAGERTRLQDQLDQLTLSGLELRAKERLGIDASNQALFDQVQAQIDLKDAAVAATEDAQKLADAWLASAEAARAAAADRLQSVSGGASDALAGLSRAVEAQKAQELASYNAAKEAASAIYKAQASSLQASFDSTKASLDAIGKSVSNLKTLSGSLKSTLDGLRVIGSEGAYRSDAQAQIKSALATARSGGGLPLAGQLDSALKTLAQPSENLFSSFNDYATDFYKTAIDIAELGKLTDAQLTADEVTQGILQDQSDRMNEQQKLLKDGFADQVSGLDDILTNAQRQLDAANGINTSVLSVADALKVFNASIISLTTERAKQDLPTSRGSSYTPEQIGSAAKQSIADGYSVANVYDGAAANFGIRTSDVTAGAKAAGLSGFNRYSDSQILSAIKKSRDDGFSVADVYTGASKNFEISNLEIMRIARAGGVPGFAGGGDFGGGLRMVGERGPELEATGPSRIFNAQQTKSILQGAGNSQNLERLVEKLIAKVEMLEATARQGNADAKRSADALNGQQRAPMLVEIA